MQKVPNEKDIINDLKLLKQLTISKSFRDKITNTYIPSLPPSQIRNNYFVPIRIALIILLVLLITGGGIAFATYHSQPGTLLYPIKRSAIYLYDHQAGINASSTVTKIKNSPLPSPTVLPSPTNYPRIITENSIPVSPSDISVSASASLPQIQGATNTIPNPSPSSIINLKTTGKTVELSLPPLPLVKPQTSLSPPTQSSTPDPIIKLPTKIKIGL